MPCLSALYLTSSSTHDQPASPPSHLSSLPTPLPSSPFRRAASPPLLSKACTRTASRSRLPLCPLPLLLIGSPSCACGRKGGEARREGGSRRRRGKSNQQVGCAQRRVKAHAPRSPVWEGVMVVVVVVSVWFVCKRPVLLLLSVSNVIHHAAKREARRQEVVFRLQGMNTTHQPLLTSRQHRHN